MVLLRAVDHRLLIFRNTEKHGKDQWLCFSVWWNRWYFIGNRQNEMIHYGSNNEIIRNLCDGVA